MNRTTRVEGWSFVNRDDHTPMQEVALGQGQSELQADRRAASDIQRRKRETSNPGATSNQQRDSTGNPSEERQ